MSNHIRCPNCKQKLLTKFTSLEWGISRCECSEYPYAGGILYLKRDRNRLKAVAHISRGKIQEALKVIIPERLLLWIPIKLILLPNPLNNLFKRLVNKNVAQILGFKMTIKLMSFLTYPKAWVRYILNRDSDISFKVAKSFVTGFVGKRDLVLDLGCGSGNLIPYYLNRVIPENGYFVDKSFLNLLIAKNFFVRSRTNLICTDVEKGLPFDSEIFDIFTATDSFHNITNKDILVREMGRLLKRNGLLLIAHTINSPKVIYENIKGMQASVLYNKLRKLNFSNILVCRDSQMLSKIKSYRYSNLAVNRISKDIKEYDPYTILAAKK